MLYHILYNIYIMNYSKYHLWLYTKLNSPPDPLPPLGVYTCSRGGEGEGKKVLFRRLAVCSEKYRVDGPLPCMMEGVGEGEGEKSFVEEAGRIFGKYRVDGLG